MKNLANCTPREFLRQTVKIRRAVENWLKLTDVLNIRKKLPEMPPDLTPDERKKRVSEQASANLALMVDAIADEHPDETAELLGLLCFVEPENVDDYPMSAYMGAVAEMMANEDVMRFFTSLVQLARTLGLTA